MWLARAAIDVVVGVSDFLDSPTERKALAEADSRRHRLATRAATGNSAPGVCVFGPVSGYEACAALGR